MTFPARAARITSIQALCLGAVSVLAAPAAAQTGDTELFTVAPASPPPLGAPAEPGPTDLFVPVDPPAPPPPPTRQDARGAATRWEMTGGLSGSVFSIHHGPAGDASADQHGNRGSIYVGPEVFLSPVVDNDAPRSLQPYLQRTSTVYGSISGDGFVTRYGNGAFTRKYTSGSVNVGADVYMTRHVALTGGFQYGYNVLHDETILNKEHSFWGNAGIGVRLGDTRVDASYSFSAQDVDGSFRKPRWGSVAVSAYLLFAESFALTLAGHGSEDGGGGSLGLGVYTKKDLGFYCGFSGGTFVYIDSGTRSNYYTGWLGTSYWVTPTLRFYWAYSLSFNKSPSQPLQPYESDEIEHSLSVSVIARLP